MMKLKELLCQTLPETIHYMVDVDPTIEATHADFRAVASVKSLLGRSWCNKTVKVSVASKEERDDNSANGVWTTIYHVIVSTISSCGDWSMRSIVCRIPMDIEVDGYGDIAIRPTRLPDGDPQNEEPYVSMDDGSQTLTIHSGEDLRFPLFFATGKQGDDDPMRLPHHGNWLQRTLGYHLIDQWLRWNGMRTLTESGE